MSLEDLEDYEVFYHGTGHQSALGIINNIDLAQGKLERDFSSGDGFYLGRNIDEALETNWARNRPPNSAVLVHLVRRDELRNQEQLRSTNLEDNMEEWKKVVRLFRTDRDSRESLKESRNDRRSIGTIKLNITISWKDQWLAGNEILHTLNQFSIRISFALEARGVLSCLSKVFIQLCSLSES